MIDDIRTVMWKEWKSIFRWRGSRMRAFLSLLIPLGIFGIWAPLDSGEKWIAGAVSVFPSIAFPLLIAVLIIPDSFAGERERHTLPTLLASRLSDRAILFGKMGFAAASAWASALFALFVGIIVFNIVHWSGQLQFYTPKILFIDLSLSFAFATISAGAGVLVSLRSATVQEAAQTLTAALFLPPMVLGLVVPLTMSLKPEWQIRNVLGGLGATEIFLIVLGVLLAVDLVLLVLAMARFDRARLILH